MHSRQLPSPSAGMAVATNFCPVSPQIQCSIKPHAIIILPNTDGMELLVCYEDEGVYVNTYGRITKDVVLQWGEMPTSVGACALGGAAAVRVVHSWKLHVFVSRVVGVHRRELDCRPGDCYRTKSK